MNDQSTFIQTLPEYEQWSQDVMQTWNQAKRVLKKGPKLISMRGSEDPNVNKVSLCEEEKSIKFLANRNLPFLVEFIVNVPANIELFVINFCNLIFARLVPSSKQSYNQLFSSWARKTEFAALMCTVTHTLLIRVVDGLQVTHTLIPTNQWQALCIFASPLNNDSPSAVASYCSYVAITAWRSGSERRFYNHNRKVNGSTPTQTFLNKVLLFRDNLIIISVW